MLIHRHAIQTLQTSQCGQGAGRQCSRSGGPTRLTERNLELGEVGVPFSLQIYRYSTNSSTLEIEEKCITVEDLESLKELNQYRPCQPYADALSFIINSSQSSLRFSCCLRLG